MNLKSFKLSIPALALGLAVGWTAGHGLNTQAQPLERPIDFIDIFDRSGLFDRSAFFERSGLFNRTELFKVDSRIEGNEVKITTEVPGVEEKDLDLSISDDFLTIKGRKTLTGKEKTYEQFQRSMSLPCRIESDKAKATLKNGVLTITAPRNQVAKGEGRKLEIQTQ